MKLRYKFLIAAAASLLSMRAVSAETITYSVSGVFTSSGTSTAIIPSTPPGTISFVGEPAGSVTVASGSQSAGNLGTFTISDGSSSLTSFNDSLVLTITQIAPPGGQGTVTSTVTGTISATSSGLTFASNGGSVSFTTTAGTVTYTPLFTFLSPPSTNNGMTTAQVIIAFSGASPPEIVPLPASSFGGLALLALMCGAGLCKKMKLA